MSDATTIRLTITHPDGTEETVYEGMLAPCEPPPTLTCGVAADWIVTRITHHQLAPLTVRGDATPPAVDSAE